MPGVIQSPTRDVAVIDPADGGDPDWQDKARARVAVDDEPDLVFDDLTPEVIPPAVDVDLEHDTHDHECSSPSCPDRADRRKP